MGIPRTLSLHESALSPSEYAVYIPLFDDLVDTDVDAEALISSDGNRTGNERKFNAHAAIVVPVREARGWLKGRYPGVESALIDRILRIFHPALSPADMLSQPQFFAVLRLLAHAHASASNSSPSSKELDPILVFIQPPDSSSSAIATPSLSIGSSSTSAATTPGISTRNSNNPFNARSNTSTPAKSSPNPPPNNNTTATTGRPFSNSISHSASALSSDEGSVPDFVNSGGYGQVHGRASSSPAPPAPNPFLTRANSIPQSAVGAGVGSIDSETKAAPTNGGVVVPPALPPRKPSFLPPPRHASQQGHGNGSVGSASTTTLPKEPPLKPPKPPMHSAPPVPVPATVTPVTTTMQSPVVVPSHVTSPLIKQGLLAAKGAQRSAEQGLEKLRTWEVIKSSSNASAPNGGAGVHRERERAGSVSSSGGSQQRAVSGERGSGAVRIQSTTRHARGTSIAGVGSYEPPTAMMERDEEGPFVTPTSTGVLSPISSVGPSSPVPYRVARSRSLHASSSPTAKVDPSDANASTSISPPVPPPRRKRPESVQVGWRRAGDEEDAGPFGDRSRTAVGNSGNIDHGTSNPMASIRRQFHHLQVKTQPGLESARAKVEGKLMPGGYGKWGSESLTGGNAGGGIGVLKRKASVGGPNPSVNTNTSRDRTPLGGSSEGSDEFEDADEVLSTDDDVRKNGWKPLKG